VLNGCEKYSALMDDWFAGALNAADESALKSHLRDCPTCQGEFNVLETLECDLAAKENMLARRAPAYSVGAAVMSTVAKSRVKETQQQRSGAAACPVLMPWLTAAAAIAATVLVSGRRVTVFRRRKVHARLPKMPLQVPILLPNRRSSRCRPRKSTRPISKAEEVAQVKDQILKKPAPQPFCGRYGSSPEQIAISPLTRYWRAAGCGHGPGIPCGHRAMGDTDHRAGPELAKNGSETRKPRLERP